MQRYLQFMGIGLLLLLAGTFVLGWNHTDASNGQWSFDLHELSLHTVPLEIQSVIFFLLFYGLGIRISLFPLHGWLPLVAVHGTIAVAGVFLLGLKTGVYALVRFVFPLLQEAILRWHESVAAFAPTGIFYAATLALMQVNLRRLLAFAVISHTSVLVIGLFSLSQTNLRRMLAFSSLSHVGLVLLWVSAFTLQGIQGALFQLLNFSIVAGGIFLLSGFLHHRVGSIDIISPGGAAHATACCRFFPFRTGWHGSPGHQRFSGRVPADPECAGYPYRCWTRRPRRRGPGRSLVPRHVSPRLPRTHA
jgi:NADH-quinone oxidoreductase subunit M